MAGLPHPCGSTQPLHPLGVQPEEQLIAERQVAMVEVLLKTRDALDLSCDRIERLDLLCQEIRRAWRRRCAPSGTLTQHPYEAPSSWGGSPESARDLLPI